jgi:hypothetical protein
MTLLNCPECEYANPITNNNFEWACESCGATSPMHEWFAMTNEIKKNGWKRLLLLNQAKKGGENMPIELEVQETKKVEEGKHTAEIVSIEERTTPYHYIDIYFKLNDGITIKEGYSAYVSEGSKLGKLLKELGVGLIVGSKLNIERTLVGKKVSLMTINERGERGGQFARVVDGSIHPI